MLASPMGFIANPDYVSGHLVNHDHNTDRRKLIR